MKNHSLQKLNLKDIFTYSQRNVSQFDQEGDI